MASNRGVVYVGPGKVEVRTIDYPKMVDPQGKTIEHGVILKVVVTNICGSDQHMVRGRTTAPSGLVLGHEITGEVIEVGPDVKFIKLGDLVSTPFNVACGRCRNCKERETGVCLTVNPGRAGGAYGYVDMGGWIGGQAEYVMVPYADFNLLKFPDKAQAMEKIQDLTCLTDILPTGYHGCVNAGVTTGIDRPRFRGRAGGAGRGRGRVPAGCRGRYRRRLQQGAARPGGFVWMRDDRSVTRGHARRANRADPQSTRSGLLDRLRGL